MRQIKRISFLIYSCLLLAAGFYGHMKYMELFYPGIRHAAGTLYPEEEKETVQAAAAPLVITFDTALVTVSQDLTGGEAAQQEEQVPAKYVGLTREEFLRCMEDEVASPALAERKKGLVSIEVQSFSPQRIVIRKSYRKQDAADSFYLALYDDRVVVYEEDKSTVYMQTAIDARELPSPIRDELVRGMALDGREKLDSFLEQYGQVPDSE